MERQIEADYSGCQSSPRAVALRGRNSTISQISVYIDILTNVKFENIVTCPGICEE
jgi:hypothetical protein